jgi:hypothetical protein
MTEQPSTAARAQEQRASRESTRSPLRRRLRLAIVVCAVFTSLALLSFYAPTYAVRYLIVSALDAQGVEHEGIDSIRVNPWTLELWAGPVRFGLGSADPGQLGELDLNIRFDPLLERRISIERLLLREINVTVTRSGENAIRLNGVPLHHLVPPLGVARQPEETGHVWSAGVDTFELRDSRLNFRDRDGGELELEVERLTLMDFNPWEPGRPGRFELVARVNDIRLDWSGEARPFADTIALTIDSRTEQIDVPKLARFTGPWGLDHAGGTYDTQIKISVTLPASGGLNGQAIGTIAVKEVDYGRFQDTALTLEKAEVRLDLGYSSSETGDLALRGPGRGPRSRQRYVRRQDQGFRRCGAGCHERPRGEIREGWRTRGRRRDTSRPRGRRILRSGRDIHRQVTRTADPASVLVRDAGRLPGRHRVG